MAAYRRRRHLEQVSRHLCSSAAIPTAADNAAADRDFFEDEGYIVLHGFLDGDRLASVRAQVEATIESEGAQSGWEQEAHFKNKASWGMHLRRACNLLSKGDVFVDLATEPRILAFAQLCMPSDTSPLHLQVFNAHDPQRGAPHGGIHSDRQLFTGSRGHCTVIWALDDMTAENGATRVIPKSVSILRAISSASAAVPIG